MGISQSVSSSSAIEFIATANGFAGSVSGNTATLSTTVSGLIKGNGAAMSAAVSGTDYAPATSGSSILYGNGSGGFSNVTIGSGLSFAGGTLSSTGTSIAFGSITSGTNTTAAMVVGTGSSLTTSGSGTITATAVPASGLTGTTLASGVTASSLTSVGTLSSITTSGNLTFSSTSQRIIGDFSNSTRANRLLFQTSTSNNNTTLGTIPAGTGTLSSYTAFSSNDPDNSSLVQFYVDSSAPGHGGINSGHSGTGTTQPIVFQIDSVTKASIDTSGNFNVANLTASQAVVTDASKNLSSLAYASVNTVSTLVQRDGSGNFSAGTITANLTGNASGSSGSCTGNAATATTLQTARAIYGNNFDGSAALTQIIASTYGGTGNGFTKFSGATTSEKTYTLPNASCNVLTDNAVVTVAQGGTGVSTLTTAYGVVCAGTTAAGALQNAGAGTSGQYLQSNGASALPSFSTITGRFLNMQTFDTSGTYIKTAGANQAIVYVYGAGGGGGGATAGGACGGGGSGGGLAIKHISSGIGSTETVTVGTGGTGGSVGNNGTAGGTSSFGSWCSATGGGKGNADRTSDAAGTGSGGTANLPGNKGNGGRYLTAIDEFGGEGGTAPGMGGSKGFDITVAGTAAAGGNYGCGGNGGRSGGAGSAGGNGSNGYIIVYEFS